MQQGRKTIGSAKEELERQVQKAEEQTAEEQEVEEQEVKSGAEGIEEVEEQEVEREAGSNG